MWLKQSSRTRLSSYCNYSTSRGSITVKASELHLGKGGETLADTAKFFQLMLMDSA